MMSRAFDITEEQARTRWHELAVIINEAIQDGLHIEDYIVVAPLNHYAGRDAGGKPYHVGAMVQGLQLRYDNTITEPVLEKWR